eukprot:2372477-Prymnesium_polylepis.2
MARDAAAQRLSRGTRFAERPFSPSWRDGLWTHDVVAHQVRSPCSVCSSASLWVNGGAEMRVGSSRGFAWTATVCAERL